MDSKGIVITIAYPETIVRVSDEWLATQVHRLGIGKRNYLRAGHSAILLIDGMNGQLDYYDFGRYVTPQQNGRVRSQGTDHELNFPLQADLQNGHLENLEAILKFLATHPQLTHGEGTMLASVCHDIDLVRAKNHIQKLQDVGFIKYAAFGKTGSNCARFVTDTLIASITNKRIVRKLLRSKWFTPSTIGNVLITAEKDTIYKVSDTGWVSDFKSTAFQENRKLFFDRLEQHQPNFEGTLEPKTHPILHEKAQWLGGIGAGAWFELYDVGQDPDYRFRRISPNGHVDVDGIYRITRAGFDSQKAYVISFGSNCKSIHLMQEETDFEFEFIRKNVPISSRQKVHST